MMINHSNVITVTKPTVALSAMTGLKPQTAVISLFSTGDLCLIEKSIKDEIPLFTMGYGRTSAAKGEVFPWVFNFPATYGQATSVVKYIANAKVVWIN